MSTKGLSKFIVVLIGLIHVTMFCALIHSCTKEEDPQPVEPKERFTQRRNGVNPDAWVMFLESSTASNYRKDSLKHYISFNASKIDSLVLNQVSSSYAWIYYDNIKFKAANYDIDIHYKDGKIETLLDFLANYAGSKYTYIPDEAKDMFYRCDATKIRHKQKKAYKPYQLHHIDYTGTVHIWEVYKDNLLVTKDYLYPLRVTDYEFVLPNKH